MGRLRRVRVPRAWSVALTAAFASVLFAGAEAQSGGGIAGVVAAGAQPELVRDGFMFAEGPVGDADGTLLFSDVTANRTYRLDASGKLSVVREDTDGANGLALASNGDLLAAERTGKRLRRVDAHGNATVLTDASERGAFLGLNDLIADARGGVYFSDSGLRPGGPLALYYLPPGARQPVVIDDQLGRPNGMTLALDGQTLLADDQTDETIYAYSIAADGSVSGKRPFARLHDIPEGKESAADGMAIDSGGRIYVSTVTGIQVFDAAGAFLGSIEVPRQPSSQAFAGPDKKTLYITARQAVYRLPMLSTGPKRLGK